MNTLPQPQPRTQPAIQAGADALIAIIEKERTDAAAKSREQFQRLEQLFQNYQQHAESVHAADQVKLRQLYQQLLQVQARITRLQQDSARQTQLPNSEATTTITFQDDRENLRAEIIRVNTEILEAQRGEASAIKQLQELQSVLQKIGITYNNADNSLRFSTSWAFVLAELGTQGHSPTNPEELHELLGRLTQRLHTDRDRIAGLEEKILFSEKERQKMIGNYEREITSLKLEISKLQDLARQSSGTPPDPSRPQVERTQSNGANAPSDITPITPSSQTMHPTPQTLAAWNKSGRPMPQDAHVLDTVTQMLRQEGTVEINPELPSLPLHERPMPHIPRIDLRSFQTRKTQKSMVHENQSNI